MNQLPPEPFADLPTLPDHRGVVRRLGNFPTPPRLRAALPTWTQAGNEVLPESDWRAFDEWPSEIKIKDQGSFGACFPAGTRVRMADGSERPIESVRLLERVLTAEGNTGRVLRATARDADDGLVRVSLWGHSHLRATAEHPVLTERGYVPAGELTLTDWVAMPRYLPGSSRFVHVAGHLPTRAMITRAGTGRRHFNAPEGRTEITVTVRSVPEVIELTPAAGRIMGLFLAEGRSDAGKLTWTFNKTEEGTLVADLVGLLKSEWGLDAHLQRRPNNSINVVVYGTPWALLFESLFANGSGSKRLHPDVTSGPPEFLRTLLGGWFDGDGHDRRNSTQGVTISPNLALGMFDAAQGLGLRPSIRRYQSPTYGTVKTRQARWEVTVGDAGKDTYRCRMDDTHVWRKVRGVEREDFDGPVFNLEVEGDHSYVAEGVGVHNCNGHAAATGLEMARYAAGESFAELSAWFVYAILCNGWDQGSNIGDALTLLQSTGTCLDGSVPHGMINPRRLSDANKTEAGRFKVARGVTLTSWQEIVSAVVLRRPLNWSICAGGAFNNLDGEGVPPVGRGSDNHATAGGFGLKKSARWGWLVRCPNSWTADWGQDGFYWKSEAHCQGNGFECYTVVSASADPSDPDTPPALT